MSSLDAVPREIRIEFEHAEIIAHTDRTPEQLLWLAVLEQTFLDFYTRSGRIREEAELWLLSGSEEICSMRWACSFFPNVLNPDWLQRLVRQRATTEGPAAPNTRRRRVETRRIEHRTAA